MATIKEHLSDLFATGLVVEFLKKDGEKRKMQCTLDFDIIPKVQHPKDENFSPIGDQNKYYRVYDLEKTEWRCVPKEDTEVIRVMEKGEAAAILCESMVLNS